MLRTVQTSEAGQLASLLECVEAGPVKMLPIQDATAAYLLLDEAIRRAWGGGAIPDYTVNLNRSTKVLDFVQFGSACGIRTRDLHLERVVS